MDAKYSIASAAMATAIFLVTSGGGAAWGDERSADITVLRGTRPPVHEPPTPQQLQVVMPPPSCPDGYVYSSYLGTCYFLRDPMYAR